MNNESLLKYVEQQIDFITTTYNLSDADLKTIQKLNILHNIRNDLLNGVERDINEKEIATILQFVNNE